MTYKKHQSKNNLATAPSREATEQRPVAPESAKPILPQVKFTLQPGPTSPAMRHAWVTFWQHLINSAKEVRHG